MDNAVFTEALQVMALGMALVFLALGILMGAIFLLGRVFPEPAGAEVPHPENPPPDNQPSAAARAAAIGLALQLSQPRHLDTGPLLPPPPSGTPVSQTWLEVGRRQQMARRRFP